jgi:transposase
MARDAGMLAALFERSMGLDDAWEVTGTWFEEVEGGSDELHVRVARRRGRAVPCPECGRRCGVHDTRERTWRHLDIWQFRTYVHCAVPRTDCPEHGVRTVLMPWEVRPNSHFTALFEAQVLAACMRGSTVKAVAESLGEDDRRLWDMLRRAVGQAREAADYSGVRRVGVDETSRAKGHTYISTMLDLDGRRCVAVTDGNDRGAVGRMCEQLEAHGGDRTAIVEVTRDMGRAFSSAVTREMPQATQTIDRFHVMRPFSRATDGARCAEGRESDEKREMLRRARYVWLKRGENLTERQGDTRERFAPCRSHLRTARACQMTEAMRDVYSCATAEEAGPELDRLVSWMAHSNVPEMRVVAKTLRLNREGILNYFGARLTNAYLEGANSLIQSIKKAARGFRNVEYFKTFIFLRLGGLNFDALARASA